MWEVASGRRPSALGDPVPHLDSNLPFRNSGIIGPVIESESTCVRAMDKDKNNPKRWGSKKYPLYNRFFSVPELKARGWTTTAIQRFLGEHDEQRPNPQYPGAAPMRLYFTERVLETEASSDFRAWYEAYDRRRVSRIARSSVPEEHTE
jgi:hypothetical protein